MAGAIWLAWQIVQAPVLERAPPALAVRLSPSSPEVLRRAAEAEQASNRPENAAALANESLVRAPFNARALRVRGLADAARGRTEKADEILTLAGNWSLRDDPTHAWLVENRLRRGSYTSSFAHADTLARRRTDIRPQIFNLFTTAAASDPRAVPPLSRLLALAPPWRDEYLSSLYDRKEGPAVLLALAIALEPTEGRFRPYELERLYSTWAAENRLPAIAFLRKRINRPAASLGLQNGDFSVAPEAQLLPFGWRMGTAPGLNVEMVEDDLRPDDLAVRIDYDGFGAGMPLQQMTFLAPGTYAFSGEQRYEIQSPEPRLVWTATCVESGDRLLALDAAGARENRDRWETFSSAFTVPAQNCSAQWLRLEPRSGDSRSNTIAWFDKLKIAARAR